MLSVDGLPIRSEQLIRLRGVSELARAIPVDGFDAAAFELKVGEKVALLPDDNDALYILLGVIL